MSEQAKIRVAVRVRPLLEWEVKNGHCNSKLETTQSEVQLKEEKTKKSFKFDHVLPETSTQLQVYKDCEVDFLISKVIEGYHATIFAYGQTGSGKTYTMEGSEDDGLIQRTLSALFSKIQKNSTSKTYTVCCSYLQIYNERIYDLLGGITNKMGPQGGGLKLRWNVSEQFTVENLFVTECRSTEEVMTLFRQGVKNRVTASHKLNLTSSRSHSIFELKIESVDIKNPDSITTSKLDLVDLAGSERIAMTGAEGKSAKESIEINKSLLTLRQVIAILADSGNKSIPPYRDSKLTCLLKQSIGGNSYCLMIACLAPADQFLEENVSTLMYATKAAYITNIPMRNDDPKNRVIKDLKCQISELRQELGKANEHIEFLTKMVPQDQTTKSNIINDERLVDSINMVRELLLSNKEMREREEHAHQRCEQMQREIIELQRENFELRERMTQEGTHQQESPTKIRGMTKKNTMVEEGGFLPEQATQFQRNKEINRNYRAYSLRSQGQQQLPILKQIAAHNFLEEESTRTDEMTNFGRRTIYQKQMK